MPRFFAIDDNVTIVLINGDIGIIMKIAIGRGQSRNDRLRRTKCNTIIGTVLEISFVCAGVWC